LTTQVAHERPAAVVPAYIGIGANLGDARRAIDEAVVEIDALPACRVERCSPVYRTAPIESSGPDYFNAVAQVSTTLTPRALLEGLLSIERRHGRLRPYRNAPRTLDLDLLLHGETVVDEPGLVVPHPRMHLRAFVLRPLADLAPGLHVPGHGVVVDLLPQVADQVIERADRGARR
jgi:2-amino-4-hydroxy-6-hydroxymethyldihydropteridine diphosphokinase